MPQRYASSLTDTALPDSEFEGLRANAFKPRAAASLEDLSLAQIEADTRANRMLEEKYAPIYAGIEAAERRARDPLQDTIETRKKNITLERLEPAADRDLNDLGISGPMTKGELAPLQVRAGEEARRQANALAIAEERGRAATEAARLRAAPTVTQQGQVELAKHQQRIAAGIAKMREAGSDDEEIEAEVKRYIKERAPQYGNVLTQRLFPKALQQ